MPESVFQTQVDIYTGVPLELGQQHTILFKTKGEQSVYFASKRLNQYRFTNVSYQRHQSGVMRLAVPMSLLGTANYIKFINTTFENKEFYAFITNITYVNNNTCDIHYVIDVLQTYMFDYTVNPCFIDRQHAETDNVGDNRVNEGLDTGPFVQAGLEEINPWEIEVTSQAVTGVSFYVVASQSPSGAQNPNIDYNVFSALYTQFCPTFADLLTLLQSYMSGVTLSLEPIISITQIPSSFYDSVSGKTKPVTYRLLKDQLIGFGPFAITDPLGWTIPAGTTYYLNPDFTEAIGTVQSATPGKLFEAGVVTYKDDDVWYIPAGTRYYSDATMQHEAGVLVAFELGETAENGSIFFTVTVGVTVTRYYVPSSAPGVDIARFYVDADDCTLGAVEDYIPKNNKLYTYPYNYMVFESPDGSSTTLRFEDFKNHNYHDFINYMSVFPMAESMCAPMDYETINESYNLQNALFSKAYPMCGVASDAYQAWYAQNKYAISLIQAAMDTADVATEGAKQAETRTVADDAPWYDKVAGWLDNASRKAESALRSAYNSGSQILAPIKETGLISGIGQGLSILRAPETAYTKLLAMYAHKAVPDTIVTKANAPSLLTYMNMLNYRIYYMKIRPEYAKMIDNYFSCYGYAVKQVRRPNIRSRAQWNYIKTTGCTIAGNVPGDVEASLCSLYDTGITFWHHPENMYRYDLDNPINREGWQ